MAHKLYLYHYLTINYGNNIHLFAEDNTKYLNEIKGKKLFELSIDNYRINGNAAKCKLTNTLTEANYDKITYIAEIDEVTNYYKYFHVVSAVIQSGYVIYTLEVDLWGTYLTKCTIPRSVITKSTRILGNGFYDEIKLTNNDLKYEVYDGQQTATSLAHLKSDYVYIVILLQYNISQAIFGSEKISRTELFCATLADIASVADRSSGSLAEYKTDLEIALSIIGGAFSVTANIGENDAQILRAWIIPGDELEIANYGVTLKCKSAFIGGTSHQANVPVTKVLPYKSNSHHIINNYSPNRVYYAGTYNNGLKLRNYEGATLDYYLHFITGDSEIKVIAQQGERQQDITQGYEVKLTTNAETKTALRKVAEALSMSISLGTSAYGKMTSPSGAGGAGFSMAGLDIVKGIAGMVNQFGIESARGNGDAFLTYYQTNPLTEVMSPYGVTYFTSLKDEIEYAKIFGINYENKFFNDDLVKLFKDYLHLRPVSEIGLWRDFLQCDSEVIDAPKVATEFIQNELARGIFIKYILVLQPQDQNDPTPNNPNDPSNPSNPT